MSDIGLKHGTVALAPHDPKWKDLFETEKKLLLEKLPDKILEVSYGGSTSVSGLPAKPIIDIFAVVPSLKVAEAIRPELESLGYEARIVEGVPDVRFYHKGPPKRRVYHLQLMERTSDEWRNHILTKQYYSKHPDAARAYANLKRELAEKFPNDREAYSKGKDAFMRSIIRKAKDEFGSE